MGKVSWFDEQNGMWLEVEVPDDGYVYFRTLEDMPDKFIKTPGFNVNLVPLAFAQLYDIEVRKSDIKRAYEDYVKKHEASWANEGRAKIREYYGGQDEGVGRFKCNPLKYKTLPIMPKIPKLK